MKFTSIFCNHFSLGRLLAIVTVSLLLCSCAPSAYFKTPNDVYKMNGTVYMSDGTVKKGLITILFENYHIDRNEISIVPTDSVQSENLNFNDIRSYVISGITYVPKRIDLYLTGEIHSLFVKRLTAPGSKIELFELHQLFKCNDVGEEMSYYFIAFPSFSMYEAIDINSSRLIPDFENKMSSMLTGCPELVNKIRAKQKGYYYSFFSLRPKKLEVIKRIVEEYNNCK